MPICPKCQHANPDGAQTCTACSLPFDYSEALQLAADPRLLIGRILNGKYEVLGVLGEGGMGVVYKVRHLILEHKNTFALKILHPKLSAQGDFQARFRREVEIAMELTHENIIQIRDFGMTEQYLLFYTMDFSPGESLKRVLEKEGPLSPERAAGILRQLLLALGEAHRLGVVHRDLKPDNVLIEKSRNDEDRARILDFGIAKIVLDDTETGQKTLTRGGVLGTPKYMSPEQAAGEPIDGRSDLYALGCILYEMLSGRAPFTEGTAREVLLAHMTREPVPIESIRAGLRLSAGMEALLASLLAKSPSLRPADAALALAMLEGREVERPAGETRPAKRSAVARAAWVGLFVALTTGAAWTVLGSGGGREGEAAARGAEARSSGSDTGKKRSPDAPRRLRCAVCGLEAHPGEKVGDMCHGEPMLEVPGR